MSNVLLFRRRMRMLLWFDAVGIACGIGAILYCRRQIGLGAPDSELAMAVVVTGALGAAGLVLGLLYVLAPRFVETSIVPGERTTRWVPVPGWVAGILLLIALIAGMAVAIDRLSMHNVDPALLLQNGRMAALESRIESDPGLLVSTNKTSGKTLLQMAVGSGNPATVEMLMRHLYATERAAEANRMLQIASDSSAMLAVLLQEGADSNAVGEDGLSPLLRVIGLQNTNAVSLLVEHGARLDDHNALYRTPLLQAVSARSLPIARILLDAGADPNLVDRDGNAALHYATALDDADMVRLLLAKGADPAIRGAGGLCPIHIAAGGGYREMVEMLLAAQGVVDLPDAAGWTPLEHALRQRRYELARMLIDRGADINRVRPDGYTLLHVFLRERDYKPAEFLIEAGADATVAASDGTSALDLIRERQLSRMLELLDDRKSGKVSD